MALPGANSFSSRNSMALIIDNETLIIPLNALIKSLLNPLKTWENLYFISSCDLWNPPRMVLAGWWKSPQRQGWFEKKPCDRCVVCGVVHCGGIMQGFCLEDHHITSRQSGAKLGISLGLWHFSKVYCWLWYDKFAARPLHSQWRSWRCWAPTCWVWAPPGIEFLFNNSFIHSALFKPI